MKKHTYIDQIILENTKKRFPKPGPSDYYMDEKTAAKYYKDKADLIKKKVNKEEKKNNLPKEERKFYFSMAQKNADKIPAPGHTNPDMKNQPKKGEEKMGFKKYKEHLKKK